MSKSVSIILEGLPGGIHACPISTVDLIRPEKKIHLSFDPFRWTNFVHLNYGSFSKRTKRVESWSHALKTNLSSNGPAKSVHLFGSKDGFFGSNQVDSIG